MSEPTSASADELFARARSGDQAAWRELFEKCYPKIIRAIRRRLNSPALRSLYDSTDFVGDVWKSLAEKSDRYDFESLAALQAFLAMNAERKVIDVHRRHNAEKYDVKRNRPIDARAGGDDYIPSHDPTASQVAVERETREQIFANQPEVARRVIQMRTEGAPTEEIVEKTGWHIRKIQRYLSDLGKSLQLSGAGGRS